MLLVLGGCAGSARTDQDTEQYEKDRAACEKSAGDPIRLQYAKTFPGWVGSVFTRWSRISAAVNACLDAKGPVRDN